MALEKEIWRSDIVHLLYKDNRFMEYALSADAFVKEGKFVHIPNASAGSNVVRNRAVFPAPVVKRTDTEAIYALEEFTSDPIWIPNIDTLQLSYDKRASVLQEDMAKLREVVAEWLLYNWANGIAGTNYQAIRTTGAATAATVAGATGTRKALVKKDLANARFIMNRANVPQEGRIALIPSDMMAALFDDPDLNKRDRALEADLKEGTVPRLYGFDLIERSTSQVYDGPSLSAKVPGAGLVPATDMNSVLCWQQNYVERAMGTVEMFEQTNSPTYYGDIYSFLVMMGGRRRRVDGTGIVAIVEAP